MIIVAPSLDAKEVSTPKTDQNQVCDPQTSHVFKSKLSDIPISNHLPLHAYCFENLSEFADWPCLMSDLSKKPSPMTRCTSFPARSSSDCPTSKSTRNSVEFVFSFLVASMINVVATIAAHLHALWRLGHSGCPEPWV
ncbi:hypothetical protein GYH30_018067 [Glycine max]|uniref:Uncharacterized protein n=2 Tax=Glycine subgen. Soja TaxID=1462606 RepID=K7L191_SOYBN|nr:hypothetical protein GYH30_018067 [Glycine max]RZC02445.1 4-coumarate--CoA ligase 2 [Glycine soja]